MYQTKSGLVVAGFPRTRVETPKQPAPPKKADPLPLDRTPWVFRYPKKALLGVMLLALPWLVILFFALSGMGFALARFIALSFS